MSTNATDEFIEGNGAMLEAYSTEQLERELYRRKQVKLPEPVCSKCHITLIDSEDEYLCDVRVIVADGEEGHADITQWLCAPCLEQRLYSLRNLGFVDHRHGGINFLEAQDCAMEGSCTTPTKYGRVYVRNYAYNEGE